MKRTLFLIAIMLFCSACRPGYEKRIKDEVGAIRIIDTHEHLAGEKSFLEKKEKRAFDFTHFFDVYIYDDLRSAGFTNELDKSVRDTSVAVERRWEIAEPYWRSMENTTYADILKIAARDLFGVDKINSETIRQLSSRISESYKTGWYDHVLKEKAGIDLCILDYGRPADKSGLFRHVERFDEFIYIRSADDIGKLARQYGHKAEKLDDLEEMLKTVFHQGIERGMIGVKTGLAYQRPLFYENSDRQAAEKVFLKLISGEIKDQDFTLVKPLQDYMMHRLLDLTDESGLPLQVHTGLLAWGRNEIRNSDPALLTSLFNEYPGIDFIIFHGSYPYGGELSVLAKNYPNVYIDMCWTFLISPSYSERYLYEWLETVPASKIMAFGGDYVNVEGIYSQSVIARKIISGVLARKVRDGEMTEEQAIETARRILRTNALRIFRLNLPEA